VKPADLMKASAVTRIAKDIEKKYGRCDILVNNAGLNIRERTLRELTPETWQLLLRANLDGAFYYHAWSEVWLGQWVAVDPTFHQFPADATHVKFVEGGPEQHVALLKVIGQISLEILDYKN